MGVLFLEDIQSKSGNGPTLAQNTVQLKNLKKPTRGSKYHFPIADQTQ